MKTIFPKIIGDLRTLGTRREWMVELFAVAIGTLLFIAAYIVL